jgi:hypothetical protein
LIAVGNPDTIRGRSEPAQSAVYLVGAQVVAELHRKALRLELLDSLAIGNPRKRLLDLLELRDVALQPLQLLAQDRFRARSTRETMKSYGRAQTSPSNSRNATIRLRPSRNSVR